MKIVIISDTHNQHDAIQIPSCDALIHCGDATNRGTVPELLKFVSWFSVQPARHRIYVPGNHDLDTQVQTNQWRTECCNRDIHFLVDETLDIEGHSFYGTPWSVQYGRWAWMAEESRLRELYRGIPARTQYLISHGPVYGHVDLTQSKEHAGSLALLERIRTLPNLQYCFTGHIHEAAGVSVEAVTATQRVQFMNCTAVDLSHRVVHPPRIINV